MKLYAETHEWVEIANGIATIGISKHAADELGDLTYIELPEQGRDFKAGESFGTVESVKAASEIFAPVAGKVSEVNQAVVDSPEVVNQDAEGEGWLVKLSNVDESAIAGLMGEADYLKSLEK